jgi:hypothetical protein
VIPVWVVAGAALAAAAVGFASGWKVQAWRWGAADAERLQTEQRETLRRMDRADTAAVRHETARQQIRAEVRYITQEVDRVVLQPLYRDGVCLDDDGLRLVARAAGAADGPGEPAAAVPAASAASR